MERTITIKGAVEAATFMAQLVREGLTFEVHVNQYEGETTEYTITLTGGF